MLQKFYCEVRRRDDENYEYEFSLRVMHAVLKIPNQIKEKRFTNHLSRKTTETKLCKSGANKTQIMAITGHKSAQSLADYDTIDCQDHHQHSHVLAGGQYSKLASTTLYLSRKKIIFQNCTFSNCKIYIVLFLPQSSKTFFTDKLISFC